MAGGLAAGPVASDDGAMFGALFGVGAIILLPIFYGVFGFVVTLIMAAAVQRRGRHRRRHRGRSQMNRHGPSPLVALVVMTGASASRRRRSG